MECKYITPGDRIDEITEISRRHVNKLAQHNIKTVSDFLLLNRRTIEEIDGIGQQGASSILVSLYFLRKDFSIPISELPLKYGTINELAKLGIRTVRDCVERSKSAKLRNISEAGLVQEAIAKQKTEYVFVAKEDSEILNMLRNGLEANTIFHQQISRGVYKMLFGSEDIQERRETRKKAIRGDPVISNRVKRLLKESPYGSFKNLARYLKIDQSVVSGWNIGRSHSYMKYLPKIAKYYGIDERWLRGDPEGEAPDLTTIRTAQTQYNSISEDDQREEQLLTFYRDATDNEKTMIINYAKKIAENSAAKRHQQRQSDNHTEKGER